MIKYDDFANEADSKELEFPDWSDMDDYSGRISPTAAFELCGHYHLGPSEVADRWRSHRPEKCVVEFVL
jgi:hypothetical protein